MTIMTFLIIKKKQQTLIIFTIKVISGELFLLTVPRRCFFCGSFVLFLSCFVVLSCISVC